MFKIEFKESVTKDFKNIDKIQIDKILTKITTELPAKTKNLPSLKGNFLGLKKYRIGNYKIVFCIPNDDTILITNWASERYL